MNTGSLDVLHLCYGGVGGHLAVISSLSKELASLGIKTGVIGVGPSEELATSRDSWPGVSALHFVPLSRPGDLRSMASAFRLASRLRSRVALIHTHRHALPIALSRGIYHRSLNLVTVEHHSLHLRTVKSNFNSASSLLFSKATIFLTSNYEAKYPLRHFHLPGLASRVVIPNGVRVEDFEKIRRDDHLTGNVVVGMASRLVPGKDVDTLLRAVACLREQNRIGHLELRIAGDGPDRRRLEQLTEELGVGEFVSFLGTVHGNDMPAFFSGLNVYVLSTVGETHNTSLLQAAASRLPIIATRVEGVKDVFTDGINSILVNANDPQSLAEALLAVQQPQVGQRIAAAGYELVKTHYSSSAMAHSYLELFDSIDPLGPWNFSLPSVDDQDF